MKSTWKLTSQSNRDLCVCATKKEEQTRGIEMLSKPTSDRIGELEFRWVTMSLCSVLSSGVNCHRSNKTLSELSKFILCVSSMQNRLQLTPNRQPLTLLRSATTNSNSFDAICCRALCIPYHRNHRHLHVSFVAYGIESMARAKTTTCNHCLRLINTERVCAAPCSHRTHK